MALDRDVVRCASPLLEIIPALTGNSLKSRPGSREHFTSCPFHKDTHPSLRINPTKEQWFCDVCAIGGDVFAFVERFKGVDFVGALRWLAAQAAIPENGVAVKPTIAAVYPYHDATGARVLFEKVRYEPKDFRIRRPDGNGGYVYSLGDDVERVVFALDKIQGQQAIYICEGEKDCQRLLSLGMPATTNFDGAAIAGGKPKWTDAYTKQLIEAGVRRVAIIPDNDPAGRAHALAVARSCFLGGLQVRVVELPGLAEKEDLSDYLDGHDVSEFVALVRSTPPLAEAPMDTPSKVVPLTPRVSASGVTVESREPERRRTQADDWPSPLNEHVMGGLFGAIVQAIEPETEADPSAILLQFLTMFGNAIGRTAHFRVGATAHHLNLFTAIVGGTGVGRKGTSEDYARESFKHADPDWLMRCCASGLTSGEGLIWNVRDPMEKRVPVKQGGRPTGEYDTVIEDHGVSDKRLLMTETEFASTLKVMKREGNTLSPLLRQAWDGKEYLRSMSKNNPGKATGAHISLIVHITSDELRRHLDETECANGFGNRFLWACAQRSKELPDGGSLVNLSRFLPHLQGAVRHAAAVGELRRDAEASELWRAVYHRLSTPAPGLLGSMTARGASQAMRLACLFAVADLAPMVRLSHLKAGLDVWRYCFESARCVFGSRLGDSMADALWRELLDVRPGGLTLTEISTRVFQKNAKSEQIERALLVLEGHGFARRERKETGGRPVETWFGQIHDLAGYSQFTSREPLGRAVNDGNDSDEDWG